MPHPAPGARRDRPVLPLFLKWDDSEFGLRAKAAGYPTVTFPGAAVWHIPWTDKNDALDWQAYFHQRNRFVAALLHSPYERGGRMVRESLNHQIAHLVSMQYSTVELRLMALEDVLDGPYALHDKLPTRLAEVNAFRKQFSDAQLQADPDAFPPVRRHKPPRKGKDDSGVPGRSSLLVRAATMPLRQLKAVRATSRQHPEAEIPAMDAKWYRIARYDSAVVSMPDGTSAALYERDPRQVPRPDEAHGRDPRPLPARVAAPGGGVPRSPRRHHVARGVGEDVRALVMTDTLTSGAPGAPAVPPRRSSRRCRSPRPRPPGWPRWSGAATC